MAFSFNGFVLQQFNFSILRSFLIKFAIFLMLFQNICILFIFFRDSVARQRHPGINSMLLNSC